jgi:OMF family outer membrane factor
MLRIFVFLMVLIHQSWAIGISETIQRALEKNPELSALRQELRSANLSLSAEKQLFLPEFLFTYRYNYNFEKQTFSIPIFGGLQVESAKKSYHTFQAGLRYTVFDGFARNFSVALASSNLKSKEFLLKEKVESLKFDVISAYMDVLSAKGVVSAIESQRSAVLLQVQTAEAFYQKGLVAITDVLQARVRLAEVERDLRKAQGDYRVALANLSRLSGIPEEELLNLEEPKAEVDVKPLEFYLQRAKERNILKAQRRAIEAFRAQRGIAKSQFFPKLFVEGVYTYSDQNPNISPKGVFGIVGGVALSFQGIRPYYQELSFGALELKAQKEYEDLLDKVQLEIKRAYEELLVAQDNIKVSQSALSFAEKFFELSKEQYANQIISQRELLEAEASLTKARVDRVIAYYQFLKQYYRLLIASGLEVEP